MRRSGLLMLAAAMLLPLDAVEAQLLFGSRLGEAHYSGDDTKIIMQVGADMLRNAPDGESRPWSNPRRDTAGPSPWSGATSVTGCPAVMPG